MSRFTSPVKKQDFGDDITFIILSSGIIPRNKNAGAKSLYPVDKHSVVLDVQYSAIRNSFPKAEIVLVIGHMANSVINFKNNNNKYDVKIVENTMFETSGQLEELRLALNIVNNKKVFIVGDVIFNSQAIKQVNLNQSSIIFDQKGNFGDDDVGCTFQGMILQNTSHGVPNKWSKIVYLRDVELDHLRRIANNRQKARLMINEAINYVVNCGGTIKGISQSSGYIIRPDYLR